MDEYISRGDVLDIAMQYCPDDDGSCSKADADPREMLDEIEALPTADVQSVKHAKWYAPASDEPCDWCSNCHERTRWFFDEGYCPKCGAKMDGD